MICECPSCDQSYELADEQVRGKSVILSCPPCNTSWIVGPFSSSAPQADQMGAMGDDDDDTAANYRSKANQPAGLAHSPTSVPPPPAYSAPPAFAAPAPMPELRIGESGSPSARRILRGEAREQRDLFAARAPSDHGRQSPVPSASASPSFVPPPPPSSVSPSMFPGASTAARGEHSLLFSVEELKKAATMRPPPPAPTAVFQNGQRVSNDDQGVIDLKPMLSAGGEMKSRTEALYTPATEIGPMGFALSVMPQQKTPMAVFAAAAAAAVLLLAVGLGFALRGGSDEASSTNETRNPNTVAAAQPMTETPSNATISPEAKLALNKSDSSSKADQADAVSPMKAQTVSNRAASGAKVYSAASKGWKMPANSRKVSSSGTGNFSAKSSALPSPPKAKGGGGKKSGADPCGCGGNLQCAMKCGL